MSALFCVLFSRVNKMSSSICSTCLIPIGGTICSHGLLRVSPICVHILAVAAIACVSHLFYAFLLLGIFSHKRQVFLKLCRSDDFEPLCDALHFFLLKLADTLIFVHDDSRLMRHRHALRLRFNDEVSDTLVVQPIIVIADPAVIQIVELVIVLDILFVSGITRFRLLCRLILRSCLSCCITGSLLSLPLGFFAIVSAALVPAILLDGRQGAV